MVSSLLHWETLGKIVLNTFLVSIPEEFYLIMLTLLLMGEFDFWKDETCRKLFDRWDYIRVFTPVIISAVLSNLLRYTGVDSNIIIAVSYFSALILIILTGDIWGDASAFKWVGKAFIFLTFSALTLVTVEFLYMPFIIYGTGKSVSEINNNIFLNFLCSLPTRTIHFSILAFLFAKKRTLLKANIIKIIFENKILTTVTLFILFSNLVYMSIMVKAVGYEKMFTYISHDLRLIVILGICLVPFLNISTFLFSVYYLKNREAVKRKETSQKLYVLLRDIKSYTYNEDHDNILWKLNGIERDIEKIAHSLYRAEKSH